MKNIELYLFIFGVMVILSNLVLLFMILDLQKSLKKIKKRRRNE